MRADDLKLDELVSVENGFLSFRGKRVVLHDLRAMGQFRNDLATMLGMDGMRRVVTRFGYYWGHTDAAAMKRVFTWDTTEELLRAGPRLHTLQGIAKSVVTSLRIDDDARLRMELQWYRSGEAEEHLAEIGPADQPVCWMLCGYASGYASFCLDREVVFVERTCVARGDDLCQAVGKDRESWGPEIDADLPFFEIADIPPKIVELTEALKEKSRQLEHHKRRLRELGAPVASGIAECRSKSYQQVLDLAERVAHFDSSVLITGESGVGKEVVARYIHQHSERADKDFVAINCGALPETLLESELFGHKAGSFTGAVRDRKGLFEQASTGTLFLDEVDEVSTVLQVKLLRVLQEREVRRVGENMPRPIDVRIMAASKEDLEKAVAEGRFRDDLYYRLRVVEISIPPLRERPEDILPLARFVVHRLSRRLKIPDLTLDASCLDHLQRCSWPGNVRELENALERAAVLSEDCRIRPADLPPDITRLGSDAATIADVPTRSLKEVEERHIRAVLEYTGDNRTKAARILGIGDTTLWRKLKAMASNGA
ncbi:MAG: sigma 54-interacting transcriptional regulator [Holophagae bacterium]|jgi:DNA-binding NtrC family response regulator/predicted hydrocarbon binding protein